MSETKDTFALHRYIYCSQLHVKVVQVQPGGRGAPRTPGTPMAGGVVCMIPITHDKKVDALMK